MTLIEVMVAILVLGLTLSALATVIIGSLRAIVQNEREVYGTSLAQEAIEELQAIDWEASGLYGGEANSASTAWAARVSSDRLRFEGDQLVRLPDPANPAARLTQVPEPTTQHARGGIQYTVHRYVTWVDRDEDESTETKRFTVYVGWTDRSGTERELRSVGERVPAQSEAEATSAGTRILSFTASPDPAPINLQGRSSTDIWITVRTNRPLKASPTLHFSSLDSLPGDPDVFSEKTRTFQAVSGTNRTVWRANLPPSANYRWPEGATDLRLEGKDDEDHAVTAAGSVFFSTQIGDIPNVSNVTVSPICVDPSNHALSQDVTVSVTVQRMHADDVVAVSFRTSGQTVDWVTQNAEHASGDFGNSVFKATLAASSYHFTPTSTVEFVATAMRSVNDFGVGGGNHTAFSSAISVSSSC